MAEIPDEQTDVVKVREEERGEGPGGDTIMYMLH